VTEGEDRMSFLGHMEELRKRLLWAALAIIVGFFVCLGFAYYILNFATEPLRALLPAGTTLIFTKLPDPFFVWVKVSMVAGILLVLPFVLYQLWKFIAPGLYKKERTMALPFVVIATALFYIGSTFAYFAVFPVVFGFFLGFQQADLKPMIDIGPFISLIMKLMLAFGAIFETPIIIVFLGLLGVVDSAFLKKGRRYFIVLAFVVSAMLTPPDVFSQIVMAGPLLVLFEGSIQVLSIIEKRRKAREEAEEQELTA
jgi:sec-independent protein translocase protein TatC